LRFAADGPSLPGELLVARDQGRVLFFCGAGVSRAKVGLPDFLGLAKSVLREIRVLPESPAQKLVDTAERQDPIAGVGGILAADRVFGLLEREFSVTDIERAVGAALKPQDKVDLSAHRTLLALSRDATGKVQLVTTNFDLLFEAAESKVPVWTPDRLPNLRGIKGFEGIVHLHGMFDAAYAKPVGGNLILSSAEFGRAYLAEGWATDFIRALIRNYLIVFVGYAADDPPVQYLLEALTRVADISPQGLYAFQAGREEDAKALWIQKGVRAIAYAPDNGHAALWETLNAWADRARDPERWRQRLIRRARRGPQVLQPHERGQIVHLAATEDGARSISQTKQVLPATWLCVFDPVTRYGRPGKAKPLGTDSPVIDPFTDHSLDSDPTPPPVNENQLFPHREVPAGVVDVLAPNPLDQKTNSGRFRGGEALDASELSPRLVFLAIWLRRVCGEPAAVWWASGQSGLHPAVIQQIEFALNQKEPTLSPLARSAWGYLLECWRAAPVHGLVNAFALKDAIARDGWTQQNLRRFAEISRCILTTSRPYWVSPLPPRTPKWPRLRDVIDIDVRHPERQVSFAIPDDQLLRVIPLLRQNLEYTVGLQREVNPVGLPHIPPIEPDPYLAGTSADRDFGINPAVLDFANLFRRLVQHDKAAALCELAAWRQHDDPVFGRLRIWAAGLDKFLDDWAAGEVLANADDAIFWGSRDQRDLLLSLRRRWQSMPADFRATIEKRLLAGPPTVKTCPQLGTVNRTRLRLSTA
jgi:SIR2-like domain